MPKTHRGDNIANLGIPFVIKDHLASRAGMAE